MKIKLILFVSFVLLLPVLMLAQSSVPDAGPTIAGLTVQQQLYITWGSLALKYLAELYSAVRNGGGLRRIILSFWFGENLPKAVANDYEQELSTPPMPKP